jgi:hypothetical protein
VTTPDSPYGLTCLEPDNYAAFALYMQCLAQDIDALLTERAAAIDAFRNTFAGLWRNDAILTSDGLGSFRTPIAATPSIFWNDPNNPPNTGTIGSTTNPAGFNFPGKVAGGLYEVGGSVTFTAGATAGSYRELVFETNYFGSTGLVQQVGMLDITEETNSGGESLVCNYQVPLRPEILDTNVVGLPISFSVTAAEGNVGTLTIPVGGLNFWCIYLGNNNLIGSP